MSYTPYPDLDSAIVSAGGQYGIDPSVLAGIWRIESGSTYPNPYVNSIGYGGLFGIGQAQAEANGFSLYDPSTTMQQAQIAAADLAHLVQANGGNLSAALSQYSGGGYSSVSGGGTAGGTSGGSGGSKQSGTPTASDVLATITATLRSLPPPALVGGGLVLALLLLD